MGMPRRKPGTAFLDHSRDAHPAPETPEANRLRLAREAAEVPARKGNARGDDPGRVRPKGPRSFVRKDEER